MKVIQENESQMTLRARPWFLWMAIRLSNFLNLQYFPPNTN